MTKHHTYFPLPKLSSRIMRNMEPGDTIVVDAGPRVRTNQNLYQSQANTTGRAKQLGMTVASKVMHIVDLVSLELKPVVVIYCITPAQPMKPRGRRAKTTEETVAPDEQESLPDGGSRLEERSGD